MAAASLMIRIGAQVAEAQKAFAEVTRSAQRFERDFANTASSVSAQQKRINDAFTSFSGDRLAREASAVAKAVEQIGGASRLTAQEQAKVNALMTEAIAKYQALGQTAPKSVLDLANATKKLETNTSLVGKNLRPLEGSIGALEGSSKKSGLAMDVLTGTFGKFTAAGVAVGIINKLGGALADMASKGFQITPVQDAFERLAEGVGESSEQMISAMGAATRGLVTDFDLMQSANKALLLGLPTTTESMASLAKTATVLGKAMGQDATKSLDDLIVALGRSSPLILDNLGLTVKVEEANRKYAASLGKTAEALTEAEKKQAFMNEALTKADERVKQIGEQSLTLGEHAKTIVVTLSNIVTGAIGAVDKAAGAMITRAQDGFKRVADSLANLQRGGVQFDPGTFDADAINAALQSFATNTPAAAQALEMLAGKSQRLRAELSQLTIAQRATIKAGNDLGLSQAEIVTELSKVGGTVKVTEQHLKLLAQTTQETNKSRKDQAAIDREIFEGLRKTGGAIVSYNKTLADANTAVEAYVQKNRELDFLYATLIPNANTWVQELEHSLAAVNGMIPALGEMNDQLARQQVEIAKVGKAAGKTFSDSLLKGLDFGDRLAQTIIGAFQGGGNVGKAIGAQIGADIGSSLGGKLAKGLAGTLGETLGGAVGGLLGPLGALGGQLLGSLISGIGGPSQEELLGRSVVDQFEQSLQGTLSAQQKLDAGNESWKLTTIAVRDAYVAAGRTAAEAEKAVSKLWASSKQGADASRLAVLEIQAVMDIAADKQNEIATSQQESAQAIEDATAGIRSQLDALSSEYDALNKSIQNEAPEEVLGIVETLARERMKAIEIERTGLEAEMDRVTKGVEDNLTGLSETAKATAEEIEKALSNIRVETIRIPIEVGGSEFDVPALASGGIVRKPTLALIGESGPEAVVPLGSDFGGSGAPIVTQVFLDGRQIAEATVPHIPHVVRRRA